MKKKSQPWTPAEDALVLACPTTPPNKRRTGKPSPNQELAERLGRSEAALRNRRRILTDPATATAVRERSVAAWRSR